MPAKPHPPGKQLKLAPTHEAVGTPQVDVRALVGEGREAVIVHNGDRYRLRITANDKLILTK